MLIYKLTSKIDTSSLSKDPDWYWTLQIEDGKKIVKQLKEISKGSYEYIFWVKPIRQAIRAKQTEVTIKTGGFATSKFQAVLEVVAGGFENLKQVDRFDGFLDWLEMNFNYSGEGANYENYWLSKSETDFNIYPETELKKVYLQSLSKAD